MHGRASTHIGSIINRTGESGGSIGGNNKPGVVRFSNYPSITLGYFTGRVDAGNCCPHNIDHFDTDHGGSSSDPTPPPPPPPSPTPGAGAGAGAGAETGSGSGTSSGPTWGNNNNSDANCSIVNTNTGGITTICNGSITFQGNTL